MGFRELIKAVQHKSGFSDAESKEALELTVEAVAERLQEEEREDFAGQLPPELQGIALDASTDEERHRQNIIEEFMEKEDIDEAHAKKQLLSAWEAIKETVTPGEIDDVLSQLSQRTAHLLS
jgi:uncharacterized protein (DUF2267 family)